MNRQNKDILREVRWVFGEKTLSDIAEKMRWGIATKDELRRWSNHKQAKARRCVRRGQKLREFRDRIGVSQSELAEICDVSRRTVYRWEKGLHTPRDGTIKLLFWMGFCWQRNRWTRTRKEAVDALGRLKIDLGLE